VSWFLRSIDVVVCARPLRIALPDGGDPPDPDQICPPCYRAKATAEPRPPIPRSAAGRAPPPSSSWRPTGSQRNTAEKKGETNWTQ
jgi:hypothetical protein